MKAKVLETAEASGRSSEIVFMAGDMGSRGPYDGRELSGKVAAAEESGAGIYMASFPRDDLERSMRRFADEVMPFYS